jgi:TetR/AcrR family transcriptional regulator, mexJK operon transcriptional repressor
MKQWSDDHPKGKLLARKRAAILDAAQEAFLRLGYDGASMEGIAAAAGVSIMTLYRHAQRKEELFAAVISSKCERTGWNKEAEFKAMLSMPLADVLFKLGTAFQSQLADPQTTLLMRAVIPETIRFPRLCETFYDSFIGAYEENLCEYLALTKEGRRVSTARRRKLSKLFIGRLVSSDALRMLLGLGGLGERERNERARAACNELLAEL